MKVSFTVGVSYKIGNVTFTANSTVSYEDDDDIINQWMYYRDIIDSNSPSYIYNSSDGYTSFKMHIQ
jgi:hypothetical protein